MSSREPRRVPHEAEFSPVRYPVAIPAELQEPLSCFLPVTLVDLSTSGCRVEAGYRIGINRRVRVAVPGLGTIRAEVVRAEAGQVALRFDMPLHMSVLGHLVARYPERRQSPGSAPGQYQDRALRTV